MTILEEAKGFCFEEYLRIFKENKDSLQIKDAEKLRIAAQKIAIKEACVNAMRRFPAIEPALIWQTIYVAHVRAFSNIDDSATINKIISADNSWKKSSGHAFEEMIRDLSNLSFAKTNIRMILQRELSLLLHEDRIENEVRDISWLKEQVKSSVFDLYLVLQNDEKFSVYGCVQSKTSIRDRVTRDREPSINAMKAFFMSVAIVLDGDFLKLPKFKNMVNGNVPEYDLNGWHGMYVFTNEQLENDRIHGIDITMDTFIQDAIAGAKFWKEQRQWFDNKWRPAK